MLHSVRVASGVFHVGTGWKRIACALDANFRVGVFKAAADGFAAEFTKMPVEPQNGREPWRADFHNLQQLEDTSALGLNNLIKKFNRLLYS